MSTVPFANTPGFTEAPDWAKDLVIYEINPYAFASHIGSGALRVIPGTQRPPQDICRLDEAHGWNPPGVIQVELEPGDVLLHDVMVVHGSEQAQGNALRRTIYYEFRAAEEILTDGPWDQEWIDRRMRLIPVALKRYRQAFPEQPQFHWNIADELRPQVIGDEETELKIAHGVHMNGSYCSAGSAGV